MFPDGEIPKPQEGIKLTVGVPENILCPYSNLTVALPLNEVLMWKV